MKVPSHPIYAQGCPWQQTLAATLKKAAKGNDLKKESRRFFRIQRYVLVSVGSCTYEDALVPSLTEMLSC